MITGHVRPQEPQLLRSFTRLTQFLAQSVYPALQVKLGTPFTQVTVALA